MADAIKTSDEVCAVMDEAIDLLAELRCERDSLKAANEAWKRAFNEAHSALEKIAGASFDGATALAMNDQWPAFSIALRRIALAALHTDEAA